MWKLIAAALLATAAFSPVDMGPRPTAPDSTPFHRGINILAFDHFWDDPARGYFRAEHMFRIRLAGFDFVRINLFVFRHMDARGRLDPKWLSRLDWVLSTAHDAGLGAIVDIHESNSCAKDAIYCRVRLAAAWRQLATRYRGEPHSVAFELLNEPHGAVDPQAWNSILAELLPIVREQNPTRIVVVAASGWKDKSMPPLLRLPESDRNILFTFHYYHPYRFTHQGASFSSVKNVHGLTWGAMGDRIAVRSDFDHVARWAQSAGRPVLLGEFGVYDKSGVPVQQRATYSGVVACEAERHGFAWSYWEFDHDFVAWDRAADDWIQPLKDALLPPPRADGGSDRRC